MLTAGTITVERKRNRIVAAYYRKPSGATSIAAALTPGTKYCIHEQLPDTTHRVWRFRLWRGQQENELPRNGSDEDLYLQKVFRTVQLDCFVNFRERGEKVRAQYREKAAEEASVEDTLKKAA